MALEQQRKRCLPVIGLYVHICAVIQQRVDQRGFKQVDMRRCVAVRILQVDIRPRRHQCIDNTAAACLGKMQGGGSLTVGRVHISA